MFWLWLCEGERNNGRKASYWCVHISVTSWRECKSKSCRYLHRDHSSGRQVHDVRQGFVKQSQWTLLGKLARCRSTWPSKGHVLLHKEEKPTRGLWAKEWDNMIIWPWEDAHNPQERESIGNWVSVTARETVRGRSQTRSTARVKLSEWMSLWEPRVVLYI